MLSITLSLLTREKKAAEKDFYQEKGRIFKQLIKSSWYEIADQYIKEAGSPISTEIFILIHLILAGLSAYTTLEGLMTGQLNQIIGNLGRLILFTMVPLHVYLNSRIKQRQNKIRLELCNIQDIMYFQTKIGTPDDVTLTYAARVANPPLREPLQYIANAPKVKKSYDEALDNLRNLSRITEVQAFSFALAQKQEMGVSERSFKTQSNLLKRNKRIRRRIIRQFKRTKLVVAAILLFACYILLASVPLIQEAKTGLDLIFR